MTLSRRWETDPLWLAEVIADRVFTCSAFPTPCTRPVLYLAHFDAVTPPRPCCARHRPAGDGWYIVPLHGILEDGAAYLDALDDWSRPARWSLFTYMQEIRWAMHGVAT